MSRHDRNFWGWGYSDYELDPKRVETYKSLLGISLGIKEFRSIPKPDIEKIKLRKPRFDIPNQLKTICSSDKLNRISHCYGKSFRDVWRGSHAIFNNPPDYIAFPKTEDDIFKLFGYVVKNRISLVPCGGGTSVVGGIEPTTDEKYRGVITVDMRHFGRILEIDKKSRSARIQAGIYGPQLEAGLKPHGLTLRHFPQSFEFSTLGGWIATRAGGHFATLYTHVDEFVQSVRVVTPSGAMESRRLPGSGAGPSEERLISGSEGIFGIITEAWMRLQDLPKHKEAQTVKFKNWDEAVKACRLISQSGLNPSNARLVDPLEAMSNGLGDGSHAILILGFESAKRDMSPYMTQALEICAESNGMWTVKIKKEARDAKADRWKRSFLEAPYLRDEFVRMGCIMETFETAVTWDQFDHFHKEILARAKRAIKEICGAGTITCRFTHLYPDGPAPYYTIIAKGQTGREIEQWDQIKKVVSEAIIELGGTITHHHAVGKDHQPYYAKQRSKIFGKSLRAIKSELDPKWILNPDVLISREGSPSPT